MCLFSAYSYSPEQKAMVPKFLGRVQSKAQHLSTIYNEKIKERCPSCQIPVVPQIQYEGEAPTAEEPRFVLINGRFYPHSPNNIYEINGEKVYYHQSQAFYDKHGERIVEEGAEEENEMVEDLSTMNPMKMYTPQGMKAVMKTIQKAQANIDEQARALEALEEEDARFRQKK